MNQVGSKILQAGIAQDLSMHKKTKYVRKGDHLV